jgi:uncharacterized damage-inducible protein DinB
VNFPKRLVFSLAAVALLGSAGQAQSSALVADLMKDVSDLEGKLVSLAKAVPADKYGWRPAAGVRSIGEVVMHVASDNYFIPAAAGTPAPAATGIKPDDYKSVTAFEARKVGAEAAVKELQESFAFLRKTMLSASEASLSAKQKMFGQEFTGQQIWILATTHLHEHLGQMIAYARSNGVVPPWSK